MFEYGDDVFALDLHFYQTHVVGASWVFDSSELLPESTNPVSRERTSW